MKILLICLLLTSVIVTAQTEPDPYSFFPSAVGDKWEYEEGYSNWTYTIVRDSVGEDNSVYLFFSTEPTYYGADFKLDTNYNVIMSPQFNPRLIYKLDSDSGDTWMVAPGIPEYFIPREQAFVVDTYDVLIFGEIAPAKEIRYFLLDNGDTTVTDSSYYMWTDWIVSGFGLAQRFNYVDPPMVLVGCVIDGNKYGTLVSVADEEKLSRAFRLRQNYPNPFNSMTIIEYTLPESGVVKLSLYNILGEEVKLIDEDYKEAGSYKVNIELTELPSGIYVYTLQYGAQAASKKLVLLK